MPADAPFIAEFLAQSGYPTPAETLTISLTLIRQSPGTALVAHEYGPPSGIIVLHYYPALTTPNLTARITTLLVIPARRRHGLARLLLKSASQAARAAGCTTIELPVTPAHPDLSAFCQATGFAQSAERFTRRLRKHAALD